jgi:hypothetical protein
LKEESKMKESRKYGRIVIEGRNEGRKELRDCLGKIGKGTS